MCSSAVCGISGCRWSFLPEGSRIVDFLDTSLNAVLLTDDGSFAVVECEAIFATDVLRLPLSECQKFRRNNSRFLSLRWCSSAYDNVEAPRKSDIPYGS
jgi:hypothetical protein